MGRVSECVDIPLCVRREKLHMGPQKGKSSSFYAAGNGLPCSLDGISAPPLPPKHHPTDQKLVVGGHHPLSYVTVIRHCHTHSHASLWRHWNSSSLLGFPSLSLRSKLIALQVLTAALEVLAGIHCSTCCWWKKLIDPISRVR